MAFIDPSKILKKEQIFPMIFTVIIAIGFILVLFSLLRMNHWDPYEIKILSGFGLILLFTGLNFSIKSKVTKRGLFGCILSVFSILLYIIFRDQIIDWLALLYAAGLSLIITDIVTSGFLDDVYKSLASVKCELKEEIQQSVIPKFIEYSQGTKDLAEMATDVWRIEKRLENVKPHISESQVKAFENSVGRLKRILSKSDIEVFDYSGQKYNEGLNVDIFTKEKDPSVTSPYIREMIEPTILCRGTIIKRGKVIVVGNN
jgi:hypothetical protein